MPFASFLHEDGGASGRMIRPSRNNPAGNQQERPLSHLPDDDDSLFKTKSFQPPISPSRDHIHRVQEPTGSNTSSGSQGASSEKTRQELSSRRRKKKRAKERLRSQAHENTRGRGANDGAQTCETARSRRRRQEEHLEDDDDLEDLSEGDEHSVEAAHEYHAGAYAVGLGAVRARVKNTEGFLRSSQAASVDASCSVLSHNNINEIHATPVSAVLCDELEAQIRRQVLSEAVTAQQVVVEIEDEEEEVVMEIDKENEHAPMSIQPGEDNPASAKSPPFLRKWGWIMGCLVVCTAVVAGLVVGLLGSGSGSSSADSPDSTAATKNYTPQDAAVLRNLLATKSPLVQVSGSAQNEAYGWMVTNQIMQTDELVWETYALATLYYATGGPSEWRNSDGWLEHDMSICDWYPGDLCDIQDQGRRIVGGRQLLRGLQERPQQGGGGQVGQYSGNVAPPIRIRSLFLADNNLNGKLPDEITLLTDLQTLVLDMNPLLVGTIPSSISILQNLTLFSAKFVGISGTFPSELGELEQLQVFDMEGATSMRDAPFPIDLWTLPQLKTLTLNDIGLTGTLPDTLLSPAEASLQQNRLSGTIPDTLSSYSWSSLVLLDLRNNELTGSIPDSLANLWNEDLLVLRLEGNALTGTVGSSVCEAFTASIDATGDPHGFSSDCSGEVQVTCSCCTICCLDGNECQDNRRQ